MPKSARAAPRRRVKAAPAGVSTVHDYPLLLWRYARLMEVSRILGSTHDLRTLLRRIIVAACELTGTEAAHILLIDPRSGELRLEASTHIDPAQRDAIVVPKDGSIAGWIVSHNQPLLIPDVSQDPRDASRLDEHSAIVTRSLLGVPLITRDRTLGVLEAVNKLSGGFTSDDTDILVTLASQASVAIETARLFQQSDLISEMVHELRTPLASLAATSAILLRHELPSDRRNDLIRTIQQETARLTDMTSDFLDLSRLESGRAHFSRESFPMPELAQECVAIVLPQAQERGIRCQLELPTGRPSCPPVSGDRAKVKQVLLNLLTNAIKYNREGGSITVRGECRRKRTAARRPCFEVTVADTGRGIAPENLRHIFGKFYRVPDAEGWTQGTGLGLAIAKKIVEAHDGEIDVQSEVGVGTTFRFTLPFDVGDSEPAPAP